MILVQLANFLPPGSGGLKRLKEETVKNRARSPWGLSGLGAAIIVVGLGLSACAGQKTLPSPTLSDTLPAGTIAVDASALPRAEFIPAAVTPQAVPASAPDATPEVSALPDPIPAVSAGTLEDVQHAQASPPDGLTPEAAQILKDHGYDLSDVMRNQQGTLRTAQLLREQDVDPFADPFAPKEEVTGDFEEYDPLEKYNVLAFEFNYKLDRYVIKPVAKGYNYVMPDIVQRGISNLFQNIRFVPRMLNNVFQAKFKGAGIEGSRFLINTTLGIGGFFDPAKAWFKLETPVEDSGQTFGRYGVKPGPYIVVPFLGSFTLRDGVGYIADLALDPFNWFVLPIIQLSGAPRLVTHQDTVTFAQLGSRAGQIVNDRSLNLEKFQGVEESTLDLYTAVRNAYLQQRARLIRE